MDKLGGETGDRRIRSVLIVGGAYLLHRQDAHGFFAK